MKIFLLSWGLIILAALFDSYAAFIVKSRFNELGELNFNSLKSIIDYLFNFIKSPLILSGVLAFALAPILWFVALNKIEVSVGYPILVAFHLIFIVLFATLLLGEAITISKVIGMILIIFALFLFKNNIK